MREIGAYTSTAAHTRGFVARVHKPCRADLCAAQCASGTHNVQHEQHEEERKTHVWLVAVGDLSSGVRWCIYTFWYMNTMSGRERER